MAISCFHCGRQYDVTLFQFGRTINCACGRRVGFEHRLDLAKDDELRFFADVNVARLVRWLRAAGLDTAWEDAIPDADLVRRAIEEKRWVLTLDKLLPKEFHADNILLLDSEDPFKQFEQVVRHFEIEKPEEFFTRCLVCNTPLEEIAAEEITEDLPPNVLEDHEVFYLCPACDKIFWQGSHTRRMREEIENFFSDAGKTKAKS